MATLFSKKTAADLFVECLENEGVDCIFGIPGEENAHMMVSLEKSGKVKFINARHENGAAFMAIGYARMKGVPGVCLSTLGPGVTNTLTGIATANKERVPLVFIAGQGETSRMHKASHQIIDTVEMVKPITKWATNICSPTSIPEDVRRAFTISVIDKPGVTCISLPEDIAGLPVKHEKPLEISEYKEPVANPEMIDHVWGMIKESKKPIIICGHGCIRQNAVNEFRKFIQSCDIGVITTFNAKGVLPSNDDRNLFCCGIQERDFCASCLENADLIICIGLDFPEFIHSFEPSVWNSKKNIPIIHIDNVVAEVDEHFTVKAEVVGNIKETLKLLNRKYEQEPIKFDFDHCKTARSTFFKCFESYKDDESVGKLKPQKIIWDIKSVLRPDDILVSDVGAHKLIVANYFHPEEPNTVLMSNGFSAMGYGLPVAIGAKLACPDKRVLAICGDGGFLMSCQEMETAKRLGTNITVMVWEDKAYGVIDWEIYKRCKKHVDVSFQNPDFVQLAESFGWKGFKCDYSKDLKGILETALNCDGPSLISVPVDYKENILLSKAT